MGPHPAPRLPLTRLPRSGPRPSPAPASPLTGAVTPASRMGRGGASPGRPCERWGAGAGAGGRGSALRPPYLELPRRQGAEKEERERVSDREGGRFSAAALRVGSWPHPPPAWSTASSRGTPESRLKPLCWAYSVCGSIPGRVEGSVAVLDKGHLRVGVARGASYRLPGWCCLGQLGTAFLIRAWGRFCVQCWGRRMGAQSWRRGSPRRAGRCLGPGAHLPDARLLAVHHSHVAGLAALDELLLSLVDLLGHEAHEGVVRGVSCRQTTGQQGVARQPRTHPGLLGPAPREGSRLAGMGLQSWGLGGLVGRGGGYPFVPWSRGNPRGHLVPWLVFR